ncbi:hypothetical protein NL526_28990, partial [Klebsiella pneumoniae]|nr:hypothetical protein [Klebsiella pneumoniae]
ARKGMSADQKLDLLASYQSRFDKLKTQTGVLSAGPSKFVTTAAIQTINNKNKEKSEEQEDVEENDEEIDTDEDIPVPAREGWPD